MRALLDNWPWLLTLPLISFLLVGCGANESLAFDRLTRGGLPEAGSVVVDSEAEWQAVWAALRGVGDRPSMDWDKELVIGVFLGERPTGGYALTVQEIRRLSPNHIELRVVTQAPKPGDFVTMAFTYPGELVRIDRRGLNLPLTVVVRDQEGATLFTQ